MKTAILVSLLLLVSVSTSRASVIPDTNYTYEFSGYINFLYMAGEHPKATTDEVNTPNYNLVSGDTFTGTAKFLTGQNYTQTGANAPIELSFSIGGLNWTFDGTFYQPQRQPDNADAFWLFSEAKTDNTQTQMGYLSSILYVEDVGGLIAGSNLDMATVDPNHDAINRSHGTFTFGSDQTAIQACLLFEEFALHVEDAITTPEDVSTPNTLILFFSLFMAVMYRGKFAR